MASIVSHSKKNQSALKMTALMIAMWTVNFAVAQTSQVFTSSGSFVVPMGVTEIVVECWGAGGGGSNVTSNGLRGGGGGGGAYAAGRVAVVSGNSYTVVVGDGGGANTAGGNSTFNTNSVIAAGGKGGSNNSTSAGAGGTVVASTGTTKFAGGNGADGGGTNSGGGGGAAGSSGAGNAAVTNTGGALKSANGGTGANGVSGSTNGASGNNYGGGESGAVTNSDTDMTGGAGANGLVRISWSTTSCLYADNSSSGITFTPGINMPSNPELVSSTFSSNSYFILNVIKGLTYQVYSCSNPIEALKMVVYEEGNAAGSAITSSASNVGNTCNTHPNNVYTSFTSPLSGQVRVLVNSMSDCASTSITGLSIYVNVSGGSNTQDSENASGTDSWIGHIYDGINFNNYLGYYTQTESFQEGYGSAGTWPNHVVDDASSYYQVHSNGQIRAGVRITTYSVRYRMTSTRRGMYITQFASDDGTRLYINGNLSFSDWTAHSIRTYSNVLIPFSEDCELVFDFYEQGGHNILGFGVLTLLFSNELSSNLNQTICIGNLGQAISGNEYSGAFPAGISLSGTGYQWSYSTSPSGARTNIPDATASSFTPNTSSAPFDVAGTYYVYRNSTLNSTNNYMASFDASSESQAAVIIIQSCNNYWTGNVDSNWGNAANWSDNFIPASGQDIEFASVDNHGVMAHNDLTLDVDRVVGSLVNNTTRRLVIPAGKSLTVMDSIETDGNPDRIYISSSASVASGSLIFHNAASNPVYGSVEMYSKASWDLNAAANNKYRWQFLGIPVRSVPAFGILNGSYVRIQNEAGSATTNWIQLSNSSTLNAFSGYEIVQAQPKTYLFKGILENRDLAKTLNYTVGAKYPGQHLIGNSYTAAIDIQQLTFGANSEAAVYLYNTGTYADWDVNKSLTNPEGINPGQYTVSTPLTAGVDIGIPRQIPSMQAYLIKCTAPSTFGVSYSTVTSANTDRQRAPSFQASEKVFTRIEVIGTRFMDRLWLFTDPACSPGFDNGWDGRKFIASTTAPKLFSKEQGGSFQINAVSNLDNSNLAFIPGEDANYTLRFYHQNLNLHYASLYLFDVQTNAMVDVFENGSEYSFVGNQTTPDSIRFKMLTTPAISTEARKTNANTTELSLWTFQNVLIVDNGSNTKGAVDVFDLGGRKVFTSSFKALSKNVITTKLPLGNYVVKARAGSIQRIETLYLK